MNFEQLKKQAEDMGFKFETSEQITEGRYRGVLVRNQRQITKIIFPADYSRPPDWIYDTQGKRGKVKSLQYAINEYNNREAVFAERKRKSQETEQAMQAFVERFGGR